MRGFAREIINRVQKLKKKIHLKTDDEVFILWKLSENSVNLRNAMEKETKMIQNAVKKVLLPLSSSQSFFALGSDKGTIDEE